MATYRDLIDRIALDYLNDVSLVPEIKRAINNAIKGYEAQRFWFNTGATSTATVANTAYIGVPSDFLALDRLEISYSGGLAPLREATLGELRNMNAVSATGQPTHFTYYQDRFELALVPNSAYTVYCYHLKSLPALSADADSNAWTNEAQNLIAHAATLDLLENVVQTQNEALIAKHRISTLYSEMDLHRRNGMRLTTRLKATTF